MIHGTRAPCVDPRPPSCLAVCCLLLAQPISCGALLLYLSVLTAEEQERSGPWTREPHTFAPPSAPDRLRKAARFKIVSFALLANAPTHGAHNDARALASSSSLARTVNVKISQDLTPRCFRDRIAAG